MKLTLIFCITIVTGETVNERKKIALAETRTESVIQREGAKADQSVLAKALAGLIVNYLFPEEHIRIRRITTSPWRVLSNKHIYTLLTSIVLCVFINSLGN